MGNLLSREPTAKEVAAQVAALPPPKYNDSLWAASCRPVSSLNEFTPYTLVFKPDCRLFCPNGLDCKLLRNQTHRDLFIHTTKHAVKQAAASSPPTKVTNQASCPTLTVPTVPHVPECFAIQAEEATASATGSPPPLPTSLRGRRVVVWVHGFRQRYFRVVNVAAHLLHRLGQGTSAPPPTSPIVLAFLWPCHARKAAYGLARADAMRAAPRLRALLRALHGAGCDVRVIGHSMGCRVALQALLQDTGAEPSVLCSQLHLLGAAVDADALSAGGEFERGRIGAEAVSVYSSLHDEVLRAHFRLGEAISGRGASAGALGMAAPPAGIAGVDTVDVSESVGGHNPNLWLLSSQVTDRVFQGYSPTAPAQDTLEGDWSSASLPDPQEEEKDDDDDDDGL